MSSHWIRAAAALLLILGSAAQAQPSATGGTVSREEYDKLKARLDRVEQELAEQKKQPRISQEEVDKTIEDIEKDIKKNHDLIGELRPGESKFLMAGLAWVNFTSSQRQGDDTARRNFFGVQVSPTFLWMPNNRLLVEAEPEFKLRATNAEEEENETELELEQMHISYVLNDYITLDAGQMLNPISPYAERLHQVWIEKLPTTAVAFSGHDHILAQEHLGFQIRGGFPLGVKDMKLDYAAFIANSPKLTTEGGNQGALDFDSFANLGNNFIGGARLGIIPVPGLEAGYGFAVGRANPDIAANITDTGVSTWLNTVYVNYVLDSQALRGQLDFKAQWAWQDTGSTTYQGTSPVPGERSISRNGGYVRLGYRPTKMDGFVKNLEPVVRWEALYQKKTPIGFDQSIYSFGLDYWLSDSSVLKLAYEIDDREGSGKDNQLILLQWAIGF
jgi:hypothetical protein